MAKRCRNHTVDARSCYADGTHYVVSGAEAYGPFCEEHARSVLADYTRWYPDETWTITAVEEVAA